MSEPLNPYKAPVANLQVIAEKPAIPAEILKKIKNGWIAALISGCVTLIFTAFAIFGQDITGFMDSSVLVDVGLIFLLAYGIYKKSRTAATLMLVYFIASKFIQWNYTGNLGGIVMSIVFVYFYYQAMIGTYQYHKIIRKY